MKEVGSVTFGFFTGKMFIIDGFFSPYDLFG